MLSTPLALMAIRRAEILPARCAATRGRHVTPFKRAHFRPPQPAHEQQRGDHGVESAPAVRRGGGFDAPAVRAGPGGGGENRGRPLPLESEALDVCETENPTRDTTHGGAGLEAPWPLGGVSQTAVYDTC